jgi:hypothetical protein
MVGAELPEYGEEGPKKTKTAKPTPDKNPFMFKDPKEYESMTQEEREEATRRMMGYHRGKVRSISKHVGVEG